MGSIPAGGTLAAADWSSGEKHDEHLLRVPSDLEGLDDLRLFRIRAEIEAGFDALRDVDNGVSVFGSARIAEGHRWYELCRETARCLVGHEFSVITGGGPGLMEAANRGAAEAGGTSIGLNIELPHEQQPNPYWIDDSLEDGGMIGPGDKELLVVADTPEEVCDHVRRASAAQKQMT